MSPKNFEVAIIGGGIAGVTLAIALHSQNVPVKIYEQAHAFGEIGAGVAFHPNAIQAMELCHGGVYEAFKKVVTSNQWPEKAKVWFEYYNGYDPEHGELQNMEPLFTICNEIGQNAVHRARFLDEMVKLLPKEVSEFRKRFVSYTEKPDGKLEMHFADGTTAEADVIVGCDGIKSQVRRTILPADHPAIFPTYTHKYAYRGMIPMQKAVEAIGAEKAQNSCMHMGMGGHLLSFPVDHGEYLNIVAFFTDAASWKDYPKLTRMTKREEALANFADYSPDVKKLLELCEEELNVWAIYDLGNPVPYFNKGRVCISGDAAHATSPHHGSGAGFCIEDSAILARLLTDERVISHDDLEAALETFNQTRLERGQWLVESSRYTGDAYEWRAPGIGKDFKKIEAEINKRMHIIDDVEVSKMCDDAVEVLSQKLAKA